MHFIDTLKHKIFKPAEVENSENIIKIFLIDDQEEFLLLFEQFIINQLKKEILICNKEVLIFKFSSAKDAIAAVNLQPHIILLDYYLGDNQNGDYAYKVLSEKLPKTEIIMVSGLEDAHLVHLLIQ